MSDHVNKPQTGFRTQEEIKLKVSNDSAATEDSELQNSEDKSLGKTEQPGAPEQQDSVANDQSSASRGDCETKSDGIAAGSSLVTRAGIESSDSAAQKIESVGSKSDYADRVPMQLHKPPSSGLNRHRAIVAACAILSCSFLGLSAFDLKHLIGKQAVINENLKISYLRSPPELPVGCSYVGSRHNDWLLDDEDYINEDDRIEGDRLIQIVKHTWDGRKLGYADKTGKIVIPPQFVQSNAFSDGLAAVLSDVGELKKWGFIDTTGKFKIPPKFDTARGFTNRVCIVSIDGQFGLINTAGEFVVKPTLSSIAELGQNFLANTKRGKHGILGQDGKWLLPPEYSSISPLRTDDPRWNGFPRGALRLPYFDQSRAQKAVFKIVTWAEHQVGLVNDRGEILLPPKYDDVVSFQDGVAAVSVNGKIGFVKADGTFVIQPRYDMATPYADIIAVRSHGPWTFIDKNGNALSGPAVDGIVVGPDPKWFSDGLGPILKDGKIGYMNAKGQIVIQPQFDLAMPFTAGHAMVWAGDCWKFIDTTGKFVSGLSVQDMSVFTKGKSYITMPGPFFQLVEFAKLTAIREAIKNWKEYQSARKAGPTRDWEDE